MVEISVEDALRKWRYKYGEEKHSRAYGSLYWKMNPEKRQHHLIVLFRWMRARGIMVERFKTSEFQKELLGIICGKAPALDDKRKERKECAIREELLHIFAVEGIFDGKRIKKKKNIKIEPKKIYEPEQAKVIAPEEPKVFGRDVDRSLYQHVSNYEPIMDEEFATLIGVKKDE